MTFWVAYSIKYNRLTVYKNAYSNFTKALKISIEILIESVTFSNPYCPAHIIGSVNRVKSELIENQIMQCHPSAYAETSFPLACIFSTVASTCSVISSFTPFKQAEATMANTTNGMIEAKASR